MVIIVLKPPLVFFQLLAAAQQYYWHTIYDIKTLVSSTLKDIAVGITLVAGHPRQRDESEVGNLYGVIISNNQDGFERLRQNYSTSRVLVTKNLAGRRPLK